MIDSAIRLLEFVGGFSVGIAVIFALHQRQARDRREHRYCSVCAAPMRMLTIERQLARYNRITGERLTERRTGWLCSRTNDKGIVSAYYHDGWPSSAEWYEVPLKE